MHNKTLAELSKALEQKTLTSEALTQHFLDRIAQLDPALNAFITVNADGAREQAKAADARRAKGEATPLTGIPIALKDIFLTQGIKTTCGSKMLDNFIPPYESTVSHLLAEAGTVMLGKTNMDEFAMGSSNENSFYGASKNPWDTDRTPGGSSGGSASAIAARLAPGALGTDTGGSIRQPAALCGITGLKPTYGRVSRYGMIAFASSLDQAGPMTRTAEDAAMILNVIAKHDEKDSTSIAHPVPDYTAGLNADLTGLKIGLPEEYFSHALDPSVRATIDTAIEMLRALGATTHPIRLPHTHLSVPAYYVIAPAECSSNLARFDGIRYGYRCENPQSLDDLYRRSRSEAFGSEVQRRILIGTYVLSSGYYDAYYLQAQKVRRLIRDDFARAFETVDVVVTPTAPTTAFKLGEKVADPVSMYLSDIFTIATNLAGLPGISIPAGFSQGLPVGLQIIGKHFDEARILNVAHRYQLATDWHTHAPESYQ